MPRKIIEFIYTLTPIVIKDEQGYWRNLMTQKSFEDRIKINLCKKWKQLTGKEEINNYSFYDTMEFLNRKPVPMKYKNVKLLGDKIRLSIADNELAQELAYLYLGVGLGEINFREAGFVNYHWL